MVGKNKLKTRLSRAIFSLFFAIIGVFGVFSEPLINGVSVYADPVDGTTPVNLDEDTSNSNSTNQNTDQNTNQSENTNENSNNSNSAVSTGDNCQKSLGAIGWLVCPTTGKIAEAVDWLYDKIEDILIINPVEATDGSPIYEIWKYIKGLANIVFIIFLLVVIYSQITGIGISNYGLKKALPKLIVAAVLVNLSFLICSLAVDVSNIVGHGLRDVFTSVEESAIANSGVAMNESELNFSFAEMFSSMAGGTALAIGATVIAFETGAIWMLIPVVLGAIVAVVAGLITIALRQAVVALLIMIAPLAIVAYMLPNTDQWFKKWRELLVQMLIFYPMFSLLFGASSLAGFAIIASATDGFGLLLGVAVQIFPLFFAWSLMKMSGTFLGEINSKIRGLSAAPLAANRAWADSRRLNRRTNTLANGVTPSARLMQYLGKRRALREEDTKNNMTVMSNRSMEYVQRKIAASEIGDTTSKTGRASRYTKNAKRASVSSLRAQSAVAHTEHVLGNYSDYFNKDERDKKLNKQAQNAWLDYGRSLYQKEIDDENDIKFLVEKYQEANKRDENNRPIDSVAFDRYIKSVAGPNGEARLMAKVISQYAKVESKKRAEFDILVKKHGLNGFNKNEFRNFAAGYNITGDGWAADAQGERLRNDDESYVEVIQGDALTKAPEKLVLYDKRDEYGLYFDMKDQYGNIVARIHRGKGDDGVDYEDTALMKEILANYDIPISDPVNNVYSILAGIKPGDIVTPQGANEIGLAQYSTTIGRALNNYKGDAAWSGAMFNTGVSNRQIRNAAQHAIWTLDSIKKTVKPGPFNVQSPASIQFLSTIFDPDNWGQIFREEDIATAVNIDNELIGGEDWELDENGMVIGYTEVDNPTYEQRMNLIKRKFIYPAMQKILPAFDRLRTSNTIDNQKPGTADAQYELLRMIEEKWEGNDAIKFDPTLVDQDLQSEARAFRARKHDKDGNLIYASTPYDYNPPVSMLNELEEVFDRSLTSEELKRNIFVMLSGRGEYTRALERFEELCNENPDATMEEMQGWFDELDVLGPN